MSFLSSKASLFPDRGTANAKDMAFLMGSDHWAKLPMRIIDEPGTQRTRQKRRGSPEAIA